MSEQNQGVGDENSDKGGNGIESAFETMVHRWLRKGTNGKWQLVSSKEKTSKTVVHQDTSYRNQDTTKINRCEPQKQAESVPTHINHKLTAGFLKRSKMRLLTRSGAGLKLSDHEISKSNLGQYQQTSAKTRPEATENGVCSTNVNARDTRNTQLNSGVKTENDQTTEVKRSKKEEEAVLPKTTNCKRKVGKRAPPTSSRKRVRGAKTSGSKADPSRANNHPDSNDVRNAKIELETKECSGVTRTMSEEATSLAITEQSISPPPQASGGIPMLCNGQMKCKMECCYKAAYRDGVCADHGEDATCIAQGCNNLPFSQGLCQAHVGFKPRAMEVKCCGAVQETTEMAIHDDESSDSKSLVAIPHSADIEASSLPISSLQTTKTPTATRNAWHSSDLPSLFRTAGCKREETPSVKHEKTECSAPLVVKTKEKKVRAARSNSKLCRARGCSEVIASEGFCSQHAKRRRCMQEYCGNLAAKNARGFCWRHAERKKCLVEGCTNNARVRGKCARHGGKYTCRVEGCSKTAYMQGLCGAHLRQALGHSKQSSGRKKSSEDGSEVDSAKTPTASHCSDE